MQEMSVRAKIRGLHILVDEQLRAGAGHGDAAGLHHEADVRAAQGGVGVLLDEQHANMALKVADFAYVLETGTITKFGTGAELLADESIKEAYLGKSKK